MGEPLTRAMPPELPTITLHIPKPPENPTAKKVTRHLSIRGVQCPRSVQSQGRSFSVSVSDKLVAVESSRRWSLGFDIECVRPGATLAGQLLTRVYVDLWP